MMEIDQMRWFKHMSNTHTDDVMSELLDKFGVQGYGVFWIIAEKIALQFDHKKKTFLKLSRKNWSKTLRVSIAKLQKFVKFLQDHEIMFSNDDGEYLTINYPNVLNLQDEWTSRKDHNENKTPESLPSHSGVIRREEKRKEEKNKEKKINKKKEKTFTKEIETSLSEQFIEFWNIYPRHESKKLALEKFIKICANDETLSKKIIDGIKNQLPKFLAEDPKYVPLATSWLNAHRWEDVVKINAVKSSPQKLKQQQTIDALNSIDFNNVEILGTKQ